MVNRLLILGGYGNFGKLICESLSRRTDIELIIAGRDATRAEALVKKLKSAGASCQLSTAIFNIFSSDLQSKLMELSPALVIHTCGPYQGQNYHVPLACIWAGAHYLDLADDRRFVCDFSSLDNLAKEHGVMAISGASSVPGLSSVAIDQFVSEFALLKSIYFVIAPGSNVDLGEATLKGILSSMGQPFTTWESSKPSQRFGWMDSHRKWLGSTLGKRWLANVNIPDLELFPARYSGVVDVRFQAGHELGVVHNSMAWMAKMARLGWITHWDRYSGFMLRIGQYVKKLGSRTGGMVITLTGTHHSGQPLTIIWRVIAENGVGPRIPVISAIILANRILDGELNLPGASPCLGMYKLADFFEMAGNWGIYEETERQIG